LADILSFTNLYCKLKYNNKILLRHSIAIYFFHEGTKKNTIYKKFMLIMDSLSRLCMFSESSFTRYWFGLR